MKAIKSKKFLVALLVLLVLVLIGSIAGFAMAKYRSETADSETISSQAKLVGEFRLMARRTETGKSAKTTEEPVDGTVCRLPGTSVNLFFEIKGKSSIKSILFLEIISGDITPAEGWRLLEGVAGKNGGKVYAYTTVLDGTAADLNVDILAQDVETDPVPAKETTDPIKVCGYLLQLTSDAEKETDPARAVFVKAVPQS